MRFFMIIGPLLGIWTVTLPSMAEQVHISVAANFLEPTKALIKIFEKETSHTVKLSPGSTGKLYAQIINGAPFEVFLAADMKRPRLLIDKGNIAVANSLFPYALGRLVVWSADPDLIDDKASVLKTGTFSHIALARPKTAPYGAAAMQVLERYSTLGMYRGKVVTGPSVTYIFQFIATGNAELGFIGLSQYKAKGEKLGGSYWLVDSALYDPIEQGAILLKNGENNPAAKAFLALLRSEKALSIIEEFGYAIPK